MRQYRVVFKNLDAFAPIIERAQRAIREATGGIPANLASDAMRNMAVFQEAASIPKSSGLMQEAGRIAADLSHSMLPDMVEKITRDFGPVLDQFASHASAIPAIDGLDTLPSPLGAQVTEVHDLLIQRAAWSPSPLLSEWLEASHDGVELAEMHIQPAKEEVETHWMGAYLWVLMLTALFGSAVRTQQWDLAGEILGYLADAATVYLAVDLVMKRVMR